MVLENENIDKIEECINDIFFDNVGMVEYDVIYLLNVCYILLIEKVVDSLKVVNEGLELGMFVDFL